MNDYRRGKRDADLFAEVRADGGAWLGVLRSNGGEAWITEPVTDEYLAGLAAGGCLVLGSASLAAA